MIKTDLPGNTDLSALTFSIDVGVNLPLAQLHLEQSSLPPVTSGSEAKVIFFDAELLKSSDAVDVFKVTPQESPAITAVTDQFELYPPKGSPTAFHWIIADTSGNAGVALNHLSDSLTGTEFVELTMPCDIGIKKFKWNRGILTCHISRFDIDPADPLRVMRTAIEIIMAPHGLITVSQNGERGHLLELRNEIVEDRTRPEVSASIGALVSKVIEEQLRHNKKILDHLEICVDELSKAASHGPLSAEQAHKTLPTLEDAVNYFIRKVDQTGEILGAIKDAGLISQHFFGVAGSTEYIRGLHESLNRLLTHAEAVKEKVNRVEERHDRQMQSRGDKNVERFTFLIGLTAPPIIADIACKMLLPHHHDWHAPIAVGSFVLGIALVVIAIAPDWLRNKNWGAMRK